MAIIGVSKLQEFSDRFPDAEAAISLWRLRIINAEWRSFNDLKKEFPSADLIGNDRVIFDIRGNKYRLIADVKISEQRCYVVRVLTYAQYDKLKVRKL